MTLKKWSLILPLVLALTIPARAGWLLDTETDDTSLNKNQQKPQTQTQPTNQTQNQTQPKSSGSGGFDDIINDDTTPQTKQQKTNTPSQPSVGYQVSMLNIKKSGSDSILVTWKNPDNVKSYTLKLYRNTAALDSASKFADAKLITTFTKPTNSTLDKIADPGKYFYAMTVTAAGGNEKKDLTPDQSFTTFGIQLDGGKKIPDAVSGIKASMQDANKVIISWNRLPDTNIRFVLYRSPSVMRTSQDLGTQMGTFSANRTSTTDILAGAGDYYYAVVSKNNSGENQQLTTDVNSTTSPMTYISPKPIVTAETQKNEMEKPVEPEVQTVSTVTEKPVAEVTTMTQPGPSVSDTNQVKPPVKDYDYSLRTVIRKYFYSGDYQTAIVRFSSLSDDPDCPAKIRAESMLFLGRTYFQEKKYIEAIKIFVKVRKDLPEEADFWISVTAAKL